MVSDNSRVLVGTTAAVKVIAHGVFSAMRSYMINQSTFLTETYPRNTFHNILTSGLQGGCHTLVCVPDHCWDIHEQSDLLVHDWYMPLTNLSDGSRANGWGLDLIAYRVSKGWDCFGRLQCNWRVVNVTIPQLVGSNTSQGRITHSYIQALQHFVAFGGDGPIGDSLTSQSFQRIQTLHPVLLFQMVTIHEG